MRILHHLANPRSCADILVMLLPGAMQQPEEMQQAGFVDAVRQRHLPLDLALLDLGLPYIGDSTNGTALQALHQIVSEHSALGYREIWLGGISIGGFMAMAYSEAFPASISRLCLLAPYPGNRILTREIRAAGGLAQWTATCADDDGECRVWRWLQQRDSSDMPEIYLGYGLQDRFAEGQALMASSLGEQNIDTIAGGHDWSVWQHLWNNFLDRVAMTLAART